MTYTPRHSVQDMIRRRVEKNAKAKIKNTTVTTIEAALETIIEKFNKNYLLPQSDASRFWILEDLQEDINKICSQVDRNVEVSVNWASDDSNELILKSLTINWSGDARLKYNLPEMQKVDLGNKAIRQLLGE